jgi:hypothetical protein
MGLPGRPEGVDPLTFLLHRVSLWLLRQQQPGTGSTGFKYLNLLERPLPDDRSIRIRQIVSLIKATELYARRKCTRFGRELNEDPAPPWLQILPGSPQYPKMIDRPDGLRGRVETREEHAELFTAGWIGRNLVSIPQSEPEPTKEKQPAGSRPEPPAGTGSRGRGRPLKTAATLKAEADAVTRRAVKRQAVVMPILKRKRWKRGKLVTTSGVGKATVYGYLNGTRAWIDEDSRNAIAEVLGLDVDTLPV